MSEALFQVPKVTADDIEDAILSVEFLRHSGFTICVLTLRNGTKVLGESACSNPGMGETLARTNAKQKLYPLLDCLHREEVYRQERQLA